MLPTTWKFRDRFEFRVVESLESEPQFKTLVDSELGGPPPWDDLLPADELSAQARLKEIAKPLLKFRLAVFEGERLVAASFATQSEASNLHMAMSCVRAVYRRQGIYSKLVRAVQEFAKAEGFQTVDSHHRSTNNPVIIAKLKLGFVVSGLQLSDIMGCLVKLTYHFSPERRRLLDVRSGMQRPEGRLRELFF